MPGFAETCDFTLCMELIVCEEARELPFAVQYLLVRRLGGPRGVVKGKISYLCRELNVGRPAGSLVTILIGFSAEKVLKCTT
jgi:hypothetical protein